MVIEGFYLDGITSKRVPARLEILSRHQQRLAITDQANNDQLFCVKLVQLEISSRLGGAPRTFAFESGAQFVTNDNDGVDQLLKVLKPGIAPSILHTLEKNFILIVFSIITTIMVVGSVTVYGIPKAAKYIAFNMPNFVVKQFEMDMVILDKTMFRPSKLSIERRSDIKRFINPYIQEYISDPNTYLEPRLDFRSGMEANAFALPSGQIIFTDSLVDSVENDNELVAVFFHELGHLKEKHMMRRSLQDGIVAIMVFFTIGNLDALEIVSAIPTLLADMSYSRDFEREADLYALQKMTQNGVDLDYFRDVMKRLSEETSDSDKPRSTGADGLEDLKVPEFLKTHPGWRERLLLIDEFQSSAGQ